MKEEESSMGQTFLNFAFVFRTDLETMEKIRDFLLKSGATLIYQRRSAIKLLIREETTAEALNGRTATA